MTSRSPPTSTDYRIEIYRLGYYGGAGAGKVGTVDVNLASAQVQPHPIVDMSRGLIDAGNWSVSASWAIPSDMVSGVYIAKLVREDGTAGASHIPFIVRDDSAASDIVFQTSDTTWQAYNQWWSEPLFRRRAGRSRQSDRLSAAQLRLRRKLDRPRHRCELQSSVRHQHERERRHA